MSTWYEEADDLEHSLTQECLDHIERKEKQRLSSIPERDCDECGIRYDCPVYNR